MIKTFSLATVLSISTGRLVCGNAKVNGMELVQESLSHMVGYSLFTHQLPDAFKTCGPVLLKRFPELATTEEQDEYLGVFIKSRDKSLGYIGCEEWVEKLKEENSMKSYYDIEQLGKDYALE